MKSELYVSSVQTPYLFRYQPDYKGVTPLTNVKATVSDLTMMDDGALVFTNRESLYVCTNINTTNCIRSAKPRLVDPYTLQYVFTFDHVSDFDSYPYPYSDFHDVLWRDKQYLFHLHILGMDFVENDYAFLPEMDLNSRFLHVDTCSNIFYDSNQRILVPALIAGGAVLVVTLIALAVCLCRSKRFRNRCCLRKKKELNSPMSQFSGLNIQKVDEFGNSKSKSRSKRKQFENLSFVPSLDDIYEHQIAKSPYTQTYPTNEMDRHVPSKSHSSGFYNVSRRDIANYPTTEPSDSNSSCTYFNTRPEYKLQPKPYPSGFRFSHSKPMSINSKQTPSTRSNSSNDKYFYETPDNRQRYVSSCHVPLYGSSLRQNYVSIQKAIPASDSVSPNSHYNNRSNQNTPTVSMAFV
jgi:hypothetical protein